MILISANFCDEIFPFQPNHAAGLAAIRAGNCGACKRKGTVAPADVTTFTLLGGTTQTCHYFPEAWEGHRCSACGNEIAISRSDDPVVTFKP